MNLKVTGNTFTVTDTQPTGQGSGTLFGPAWQWTYFKGAYQSTGGTQIDDENYMADPAVLVARKTIRDSAGKVMGPADF